MKTYTLIHNSIAKKLKPADLLRYTAIAFTPRVDNATDCTYEQIGMISGEGYETIKDFVTRLKKLRIIPIEEKVNKDGKRNVYHIKEPIDNFKIINKSIFELPIEVELKGFLIQLKSICLNNTDRCEWTIHNISNHINCSRITVTKYINKLLELGYINKIDKGYEITVDIFNTKNQDE